MKVIRLTESDLYKIVEKVLEEQTFHKENCVTSQIDNKITFQACAVKFPTGYTITLHDGEGNKKGTAGGNTWDQAINVYNTTIKDLGLKDTQVPIPIKPTN